MNVKYNHLTRTLNILCGEDNTADPWLAYCSQPDGLWIARRFNNTVIGVRVRCGTTMNLQGKWSVSEFVNAMKTGKQRISLPVTRALTTPLAPYFLQPIDVRQSLPLPRNFPRILNKIKNVLGGDAEVIIAPSGIYAGSNKGKFYCLPKCDSLPASGAFKLPPSWVNLANDKLIDGMRYKTTRSWIYNGYLQIVSPFWFMDTALQEVPAETLTGYPVYRCYEKLPVIKTNIGTASDGKILITTALCKFALNI